MWNKTTAGNTTIKDALDFMLTNSKPNIKAGDGPASELYPAIAAVGAAYGDPNGTYAAFLANADTKYPLQPYFLFNQVSYLPMYRSSPKELMRVQNFSDSGLAQYYSGVGHSISLWGAGFYSSLFMLMTVLLSL